jgi:hypothetical protein
MFFKLALRPLDEVGRIQNHNNTLNPNSSTSVYRNIFFLAFFLRPRIHLLGRVGEKERRKRICRFIYDPERWITRLVDR